MSATGLTVHKWATHGRGVWSGRFARFFKSKWLSVAGWVALGLVLLTVPAQLLYPSGQALPYMRVGGLNIGGQSQQELLHTFGEYANSGEATIATPSKEWRAKWQDIGLTIDPEASAQVATEYPWWERLIPLSGIIKVIQSRSTPMVAIVDNERLQAFATKIVAEDTLAARDATIRVENGVVVVDEAKNGYQFEPLDVKMQVQRMAITTSGTVRLVPDKVAPLRPAADLAALSRQTDTVLAHTPTFTVADRTYTPNRVTIGQWISFAEDPNTKVLNLQLNNDAIKQYLEAINKDIAIDPGTSTVTLVDGIEVGRTAAPQGRSVAVDGAVENIKNALLGDQPAPTIALQIQNVPPRINTVRNYSQTSAGLLAIIRDWEASAPGDYGVIVRELEGERRYAEWQPDKQYVTASTFKMFVAYALLKKIYEGIISYGQTTDIGWTVDACLTEMIVNSTNPCSVSFLNLIGWNETQRMVNEAGFTSTLIDNGCCEEKHSTVRDETNFLLRLNAGTLLDPGGTDRLLSMFKRQVWRSGIPSGVPKGTVVADKVGFYAGYIHDVAIVYAPKGTYILGIMSYGGTNPSMAELSRRVYNFFQN